MNNFFLIYWALAGLITSAVLAGAIRSSIFASGFVAGLGGGISTILLIIVGMRGLIGGRVEGIFWHWHLQINAFNSVWLVTVALCGFFISLYNCAWHRHHAIKANGLLVNLVLAASVVALVADNFATLVVMTEIVSLTGYLLTGCNKSGKLWYALGRLGTLLLLVTCWLLWRQFGTLSYGELRQLSNGTSLSPQILLFGLAGFGILSGTVPLHGWVPQAHANASAPAAALFSAVVMKIGLFGILNVAFISNVLPLWWGMLLVISGILTAFLGGLYALMEHNINRLLAYHSVENTGIILLAIGAGMMGHTLKDPVLMALGMTGGMYHLLNHSLFKTTLFLGAGAVWFRTGHRDIEKLGGIGKRMPVISFAMLVGLMAMAALPPLNGFAGEWIIYQSFFRLGSLPMFVGRLTGPLLAVGLSLTGALALMCMAKVYGVTFLGMPRTREAKNASSAPRLMNLTVSLLALCCIVAGVAAPLLLPLLQQAVSLPLRTAQTSFSPPAVAILLLGGMVLPYLVTLAFHCKRLPHRIRGAAWVCGYGHEQDMVITATGFAQPVKIVFSSLFRLRDALNPGKWIPGWRCDGLAIMFRRMAILELVILLVAVIALGGK